MLDLSAYTYVTGITSGSQTLTSGNTYIILPYSGNVEIETGNGNTVFSSDKPIKLVAPTSPVLYCTRGLIYTK